jgi:hypothetical protein
LYLSVGNSLKGAQMLAMQLQLVSLTILEDALHRDEHAVIYHTRPQSLG